MKFLIGAFKPACNISITFSDGKSRKQGPQASAPPAAPAPTSSAPVATSAMSESVVYGRSESNLVARSNLEGAIQQILDMGGLG